jgi:hypothetical protein
VLLVWNTKLLWQTCREFLLAFKTGLWQLVTPLPGRRYRPGRLKIALGGICVLFLIGIVTERYMGPSLIFALVAFYFVRMARRRLDLFGNADQLAAVLTKLGASGGPAEAPHVAIPADVFKEIGDIEDAHIQRRRALAIADFLESGHGYGVLKSRAMIADIAKLDDASQLRVEARIAELPGEALPTDTWGESGGLWRVPVAGTSYRIVGRVDEAARRIELLSLETGIGAALAGRTSEAPGDDRHE